MTHISGQAQNGDIVEVRLTPKGSPALNFGFDVTPARLVTQLITDLARNLRCKRERAAEAVFGDGVGVEPTFDPGSREGHLFRVGEGFAFS